ncbi:hypothetical protein SteCoe_13587 [Stentor coeruleus]|uniref:RING-CH-type domain-containing protein n=1 Tax=Stentor coeruleus TaxID=5963 RepID=A0A1R2BVP1_9CILI|nr:hypothetical protein SteCoe_18837 [Stentor coeruleus]OMJ85191.1 hypothetical protein SteCoe_13587 [Stentor coeruleus]
MDISKIAPLAQEAEITLNRSCRICMESEALDSPLLSPCKCSGTIRYIHEECLKTWLVSHSEDLAKSCCELCKMPFSMEFKMKRKCKPKQSCTTGLNSCLFVPVLSAIVIVLFIIVYLLADRYLSTNSGSEEKGYTIALILTCAISGLILTVLIISSLKEACLVSQLEDWTIFSQNFEEEDEAVDIHMEEWPRTQILIVPETTVVDGVKIKTPVLKPILHLIKKRGNMAAYTPQCCTPALSQFRTTPVPPAARSDPFKPKNNKSHASKTTGYKSIPDDSLNYI